MSTGRKCRKSCKDIKKQRKLKKSVNQAVVNKVELREYVHPFHLPYHINKPK